MIGKKKPPKNAIFLNEDLVINMFIKSINGTSADDCYCKVCGCFLVHDEKFWLKNKTHTADITIPFMSTNDKRTFLSIKNYNGHLYRRCVCDECIKKKYPNYKGKLTCTSAFYTQYAYGVSNEDFEEAKLNVCQRTEEQYIKHFGKELGSLKWQDYCKKESVSNTFEYKKEKFGWDEKQFKEYNKSRAVTLKNLINKYGKDKGKEAYLQYIEKLRYTASPEYFIKKFGEEIGLLKYNAWMKNWISSSGSYSKISLNLFWKLYKQNPDHEIYFAELNHEYSVGKYRVDYYDKTLNLVIEFYGDLFHANPKKYKADEIVPVICKKSQEIWRKDEKRFSVIKNLLNCELKIIWESDYIENPEFFINNNNYNKKYCNEF